MYPEVEAYLAAIKAADAQYRTAEGREKDAFLAALRRAEEDGWDALKASEAPLVRWIADNCYKNFRTARKALRALPATLAELDALAAREGWCEAYDTYRHAALKAGVLSAPAEPEATA